MSDKCRLQLENAGLDKVKAAEIVKEIEELVAEANKKGEDPSKAIKARIAEKQKKLIQSEYKRAKTLEKRKARFADLENSKNVHETLESFMSRSTVKNATEMNVESAQLGYKALFSKLKEDAVRKIEAKYPQIRSRVKDGSLDKDVLIYAHNRNADVEPMAKAYYDEVIKPTNNKVFHHKKSLGADALGYRDDYTVKSRHSASAMEKMGYEKWRQIFRSTHDMDKIHKNPAVQDEALQKFYKAQMQKRTDFKSQVYDANVKDKAKLDRMEAEQKFEFLGGEARHKYDMAMEHGTLEERLFRSLEMDAVHLGNMKVLGPNPETTWANLKTRAAEIALERDGGLSGKKLKKVKDGEESLEALASEVLNPNSDPALNQLGKAVKTGKIIANIKFLNDTLVTTPTDLAYSGGIISASSGDNFLGTMGKVVKENAKLFASTKYQNEIAGMVGVFIDEVNHSLVESYGGGGGNKLEKFHTWFMKWSGLPRQAKAARLATAKLFSTAIANQRNLSWDNIDLGLKETFQRAGIDEGKWDKLRTQFDEFPDGNKGITPESISKIEGITPDEADDLSLRLASILRDVAELGSPTPRAKEKVLFQSKSPNTYMGAIGHSVAQYKSFSLSMLQTMKAVKNVGAEGTKLGGIDIPANNYKEVAATVATATALGYAALSMKDTLKGRELRDPTDPKTWADSLAQSGAATIVFDFLYTDYSSGWRKLGADILGPNFSTLEDGITFVQAGYNMSTSEGKERAKAFRKLLGAVERNTPSIPFARDQINREVFNLIHQKLNTGKRLNKRKTLLNLSGVR